MPDACGPYTVEFHDMVVVGHDWEPIESSWECRNPFKSQDDARIVAKTLALRADGDLEYRVVSADRAVLAIFRVVKQLEVRHPVAGVPDRVRRMALPPGIEIPMISDVL